jgi:hypothetical protein
MRAECRRGKALGEPYEGKPHVRFDEGVLGRESRQRLNGHEAGNGGYSQGEAYGRLHQCSTLQARGFIGRSALWPAGRRRCWWRRRARVLGRSRGPQRRQAGRRAARPPSRLSSPAPRRRERRLLNITSLCFPARPLAVVSAPVAPRNDQQDRTRSPTSGAGRSCCATRAAWPCHPGQPRTPALHRGRRSFARGGRCALRSCGAW